MTNKNKKLYNNEKPTTKLRHSHHFLISLYTYVPQHSQSRSRLYNYYPHICLSLSDFFLLSGWLTAVLLSYMSSANVGVSTVTNILFL